MLMHLTEHLPDSKYDSNDNPNGLRLFGAGVVSKKRNTTGMDMNKVLKKMNKRGAASNDQPVLMPTSESEYQSIKAKLKPIVSPKGQEGTSNASTLDHDLISEEKSAIIKRIIKVKQDLDSEFARMAAPEQVPRSLDPLKP